MELVYFKLSNKHYMLPGFEWCLDPTLKICLNSNDLTIKDSGKTNIYSSGNVYNVNCILGKNGAGKTTMLNCISQFFGEGDFGARFNFKGLLMYKENRTLYLYNTLMDINVTNESINNFNPIFSVRDAANLIDKEKSIQFPKQVYSNSDYYYQTPNCSVVIYSSAIDFHVEHDHAGQIDISTQHLLRSDVRRLVNGEPVDLQQIDAFLHAERFRNIQFLEAMNNLKYYNHIADFLPKQIRLFPTSSEVIKAIHSDALRKHNDSQEINQIINDLKSVFSITNRSRPRKIFFYNLCLAIIIHLFRICDSTASLAYSNRCSIVADSLKSVNKKLSESTKCQFIIETILQRRSFPINPQPAEAMLNLIDMLNKLTINRNKKKRYDWKFSRNNAELILPLVTENDFSTATKLIQTYNKARFASVHFFGWDWHRLSTGEQTWLSLLSRLHAVTTELKKDVLLLLDEGATGMHPEWERCFVDRLLHYLQRFFQNTKFHVILTSHSPLVASDFPRDNLVFLDRVKGIGQVNKDKQPTFAENIYTLLNNAFFMEDSTGEFARKKIEWIVEQLDHNDSNSQKRSSDNLASMEHLKELIDLIGEPIIHGFLREKWNRIRNKEIHQIES